MSDQEIDPITLLQEGTPEYWLIASFEAVLREMRTHSKHNPQGFTLNIILRSRNG
jgi:hypothetical protein